MAWRGIHISQPAHLSLKDNHVVVRQDDASVAIPLEDVLHIILDTVQVTITGSLMSAAMEYGIGLIVSDRQHMPIGISLPFHTHHRQAAIAATQISLSEPFKKRCWQALVIRKIENQGHHLESLGLEGYAAVFGLSRMVDSGDTGNIEAIAAQRYWKALFADFTRDREPDLRNAMLNYGYAVVRSMIARSLVASGCLPCIGLHHRSISNSFNLADDMIEVFRPFVDRIAHLRVGGRAVTEGLTLDDRRAMAAILFSDVWIVNETMTLAIAIDRVVESLVRAMTESNPRLLLLPSIKTSQNQ